MERNKETNFLEPTEKELDALYKKIKQGNDYTDISYGLCISKSSFSEFEFSNDEKNYLAEQAIYIINENKNKIEIYGGTNSFYIYFHNCNDSFKAWIIGLGMISIKDIILNRKNELNIIARYTSEKYKKSNIISLLYHTHTTTDILYSNIIKAFNIDINTIYTESTSKKDVTMIREILPLLKVETVLQYAISNKAYASDIYSDIKFAEEQLIKIIKESKALKSKGKIFGGSQTVQENTINYIFKTQDITDGVLDAFKEEFETSDPEFYKKALTFANKRKTIKSTPKLVEYGIYAEIPKSAIDKEVLKETPPEVQLIYEVSE